MQQTDKDAISLADMVMDCDAQMQKSFLLMSSMLLGGKTCKREILQAFGFYEDSFHMCCDVTNAAVAQAIRLDTGATDEERRKLRSQVGDLEFKWQSMLHHVEQGIRLFGVIADVPSQWMMAEIRCDADSLSLTAEGEFRRLWLVGIKSYQIIVRLTQLRAQIDPEYNEYLDLIGRERAGEILAGLRDPFRAVPEECDELETMSRLDRCYDLLFG